jgi:hypothetical protein
MRKFNPMTDVPENDKEVSLALQRKNKLVTSNLIGIYQFRRAMGEDVIEAYKNTLLDHVAAFEKGKT